MASDSMQNVNVVKNVQLSRFYYHYIAFICT